jgi:hypothetical protein
MSEASYRCLIQPSQPIMDRVRCIARGLKPELFDECVGCKYTIQRKATTTDKERTMQTDTQVERY